jgi:hypothetical protein
MLQGTTIGCRQVNTTSGATLWSNTTTNESGFYMVTDLLANTRADIFASKSGYFPQNKSVTAAPVTFNNENFPLIAMSSIYNAGVGGIIMNATDYEPLQNAVYSLFTYPDHSPVSTCTTASNGVYMLDTLLPFTTYSYSASATHYYTREGTIRTNGTGAENMTIEYLLLNPVYPNISIYGTIYDAVTGARVPSANITISQSGNVSYLSADVNGYYSKDWGLIINETILKNTTYTGYYPSDESITFYAFTGYQWDTYLMPYDIAHNGTAIAGIAYGLPFYTPVDNASVTLYNLTWNQTIQTNRSGFYLFDDLVNGSAYVLYATKTNFTPSTKSVFTGENNSITVYHSYLDEYFDVRVDVFDRTTGAPLNSTVYMTTDSTSSYSTNNSAFAISMPYGRHTFDVSAANYVSSSFVNSIYTDSNLTVALLSTTAAAGGMGIQYPPISTEIQFYNQYFNPLPGLVVTMTPVNTTTGGNWTILKNLYGIGESNAYSPEQPVSGITDASGLIIFPSIKPVYYHITATNATAGISYDNYIQVSETRRVIMINTGTPTVAPRITTITSAMSCNYDNETSNWATCNISYSDPANDTTMLMFYIEETKTGEIVNRTFYNNTSSVTYSKSFVPSKSLAYKYGYAAVNRNYGYTNESQPFTGRNYVEPFSLNAEQKQWLAIIFLIVVGAIFSIISVKIGAVVLPLFGALFWRMGWITFGTAAPIVIVGLVILGVMIYIRSRENFL